MFFPPNRGEGGEGHPLDENFPPKDIFYFLCLPIVKPTLTPGAVRLWDPQRPQSSPRQASVRGWRLRVPGPAFLHPAEGGAALGVRLPAGPGVLHLLPTRMFHLIRAAV